MIKGLVSIVIPTYNRASLLKKCLNSIINQTYNLIEVLVIDDGSTDNTNEIVQQFVNNNDRNVYYYYKKNEGAVIARNYGLIKCQGEFIVFQDSDDVIDVRRIELQVKSIISKPSLDACVCSIVDFQTNEYLFKPNYIYHDMIKSFIKGDLHGGTQAWMYTIESVKKINGYDEMLVCNQDLDLTFRILSNGGKIIGEPKAISFFYNHDGDRVSNNARTQQGILSIYTFYRKKVNFIIDNNRRDLIFYEIRNLFYFYVELLRYGNTMFKKRVKFLMLMLLKQIYLGWSIYFLILTTHAYYYLSSIKRLIVNT